jgi:hypothetical protein
MATCSMGFEHAEPEPEVIPVPVESGPNENDVRIAEIEAAASIEREKIWTDQQALALEASNEELRGEIRGMREVLDRLVPPEPDPADAPPPAPVIVESAPGEAPDEVPAPGDTAKKAPSKGGGYWSGYAKA